MKRRILRMLMVGLGLFGVLLPVALSARNYGVFVDGSYSPGRRDTRMDSLVDRRIDSTMAIMGRRDTNSQRTRVDTKKGLEDALKGINCKCGDTLTIVMMGHGTKNSFSFTKEGRRISAKDLKELLDAAAVECCCKIHVVIFACHSGSFIDDLFENEHVISVYTSCDDDEKSYSDSEDGDWMDGFNQDLKEVPAGTNIADALQKASETAEEKMPDEFAGKQHPRGWRRGALPVKAHVRRVRKGRKPKIEIHFYEPEFLRCTKKWIDVKDVNIPEGLKRCNWVTFTGEFGKPSDPVTPGGDVSTTTPPTLEILAHVVGRRGSKVMIHTLQPKWLYCKRRWLKVDRPGTIDRSIKKCKWIKVTVTINDPDDGFTTTDTLKPVTPTFPSKVHVEGGINHDKGTFKAHVLAPPWFRCNHIEIKIPPGEKGKLDDIKTCDNVRIDIRMDPDRDGNLPGSHLAKIPKEVSKRGYDAAVRRLHVSAPVAPGNPALISAEVANLGTQTIFLPIHCAAIDAARMGEMETWLHSGEGLPPDAFHAVKEIEDLGSGESQMVTFNYTDPANHYWVGVVAQLAGDENPTNNTATTTGYLEPEEPDTTGTGPEGPGEPLPSPDCSRITIYSGAEQGTGPLAYAEPAAAQPGATVIFHDSYGNEIGQGPAGPDGSFEIPLAGELLPGMMVTVTQAVDGKESEPCETQVMP